MSIISEVFGLDKSKSNKNKFKQKAYPKMDANNVERSMLQLLSVWDKTKQQDQLTLTDLNKIKGFFTCVSKDPAVYKHMPSLIYGSRFAGTKKYYEHLKETINMEDFLNKVKNAAFEPGKYDSLENEKAYLNLYKDIFNFRRSKNDKDAYNELDHIQKSKDIIKFTNEEIQKVIDNPFNTDLKSIQKNSQIIAEEVMKYPKLIEDIPSNVLYQHKINPGGINFFYDHLAENYINMLNDVRNLNDEERMNGKPISESNLALEEIAKGLDDYLIDVEFMIESQNYERYDDEMNFGLSDEEFERNLQFEENIGRFSDTNKDETFLGMPDPLIESTDAYQDEPDYDFMVDYYNDLYGATLEPININEVDFNQDRLPVGGALLNDHEGDELDDLYDLDKYNNDVSISSIEKNQERNYLESIERAGTIEVEFNSLVERLSSRDIEPISNDTSLDIQEKLASIIAREPNLYMELPYNIANPFDSRNEVFFENLAEQVEIQGNEVGEDIINDLKTFNNNKDKEMSSRTYEPTIDDIER